MQYNCVNTNTVHCLVNQYKLVIFNTLFKYDKVYLGVTLLIIIGWGGGLIIMFQEDPYWLSQPLLKPSDMLT